MLQRFATRSVRAARTVPRVSVFRQPVACFSDFEDGDGDDEEDREDPIITKHRPDIMPKRQTMPEAAKRSRFKAIAPKFKGEARRRILDEFKKNEVMVKDDDAPLGYVRPDAGVLEGIQEFREDAQDMEFSPEVDDEELNLHRMGLLRQIVHVDKVQKTTTQGNILRFRAMVVVGNMRGCAGYALGKAGSVPEAIERATRRAIKDFTFVDRFDNRTLFHEVHGKWNSCTLFLRPSPEGKGLKVSDTVSCVLDCFGISDVVSKCHGQRNPYTVIKATFNALTKHESAEEIARRTGQRLVEVSELARQRRL